MSTLAQRSCHSTTFLPSEPGILQGPREVQRPVQHNLPLTNTLMAQRWEQEEPEGIADIVRVPSRDTITCSLCAVATMVLTASTPLCAQLRLQAKTADFSRSLADVQRS